jgi:hypothetical protein
VQVQQRSTFGRLRSGDDAPRLSEERSIQLADALEMARDTENKLNEKNRGSNKSVGKPPISVRPTLS